jgi:hypothetical protein
MKKATFKHLLLIALTLTASGAHADAIATPLLFQEIQSRVKTLTHTIDTYSWTSAPKLGATSASNLSPTDARGRAFVQSHLNAFENSVLDSEHEAVGTGLYLAVDPIATLYYGGQTNWVLLKLPFQVGTKFFDIRDNNVALKLAPAIVQELSLLGCPALNFYDLTQIGVCRKFLVKIIDTLGVDLIAYTYTTIQFQNIPNRAQTSFLLTSGKKVNWDLFRVFTNALPSIATDPDNLDRSVIETSFVKFIAPDWLTAGQTDIAKFLASIQPWSQIPAMADDAWMSYITQHYFEAGSYPEDQYQPVITSPATTP